MQAVPVLIVVDFASPYCWLAEAALRVLRREGTVAPEYRALELWPAPLPLPAAPDVGPALALAGELGLPMRQPSRAVRTRKAHELALLARQHGCEEAVREGLYAAYFRDDLDLARVDVLVAVAVAAGLDATEAKVVLDIDSHTAAVQAGSAQLRAAGIVAAPLAVLGSGPRRVRMEGAFTLEEWRQAVSSTPFES